MRYCAPILFATFYIAAMVCFSNGSIVNFIRLYLPQNRMCSGHLRPRSVGVTKNQWPHFIHICSTFALLSPFHCIGRGCLRIAICEHCCSVFPLKVFRCFKFGSVPKLGTENAFFNYLGISEIYKLMIFKEAFCVEYRLSDVRLDYISLYSVSPSALLIFFPSEKRRLF